MNILSRLCSSILRRPVRDTASGGIDNLINYLAGGVRGLSGYDARRVSTVFSCIRLLSDAVSSLPLKLYRRDKESRHAAVDHPLYDLLALRPCPWMDKQLYWKFNLSGLLLYGFFVSHVIRSEDGRILRLVPVDPRNVDSANIHLSDTGELIFPITNRRGERRLHFAKNLFFAYYDTLDGIHPASPIQVSGNTLSLAADAELYGSTTLKKQAVPPGYFSSEQKLNAEQTDMIRSQLSGRDISSAGNLILPYGMQYHTVSMTASDLQMLETRRYQKEEICGIFGVPPHLIGDTQQAKGWSTMEQTMTEFLQLSLNPLLIKIENAISTRLLPLKSSEYAKFEIGGLLRGDITARTNYYKTMNMVGALSANEIRGKEELNPIPGGDTYFVQSNMSSVNKGDIEDE